VLDSMKCCVFHALLPKSSSHRCFVFLERRQNAEKDLGSDHNVRLDEHVFVARRWPLFVSIFLVVSTASIVKPQTAFVNPLLHIDLYFRGKKRS
jgi:hypothetical protein